MTVDDENSVYVGGIPYDSTEQSLRRDFGMYGAVVAVKIINDHGPRGKCYAFVTFTNPRSAYNAIDDMDGGTIGGRVVRVNGVKTRGRRPNFSRESSRRNIDKSTDWDRGRDRERDYGIDRDQYRNQNSDRSRERDRSRDNGQDRDRGYDDEYDRNQTQDHMLDRDRDRDEDRYLDDNKHDRSRNRDQDWEDDHDLDFDRDREMDRTDGHGRSVDGDKSQHSRKQNGSNSYDQRNEEISSDSTGDFHDKVKEEMEQAIQRRDKLTKECVLHDHNNKRHSQDQISHMEEMLEEKKQHVLDLHKNSQKLEDALSGAKKLSLQQKKLLTKLYKRYQQVKDSSEKLKSSEQELESLIDTARIDIESDTAVTKR